MKRRIQYIYNIYIDIDQIVKTVERDNLCGIKKVNNSIFHNKNAIHYNPLISTACLFSSFVQLISHEDDHYQWMIIDNM